MQPVDKSAQYPKAAKRLHAQLPDEILLWLDGQRYAHGLKWLLGIVLLGVVSFIFAGIFEQHSALVLERIGEVPWVLRDLLVWSLGHVYILQLLAGACFLFAVLICISAWRTLYAITDKHLVMLGKHDALFLAFPLNNIDTIKATHVDDKGAGDVEIRFIEPIQLGRMQRRGCALNAVWNAQELCDFLQKHVDVQPPADLQVLPETSL